MRKRACFQRFNHFALKHCTRVYFVCVTLRVRNKRIERKHQAYVQCCSLVATTTHVPSLKHCAHTHNVNVLNQTSLFRYFNETFISFHSLNECYTFILSFYLLKFARSHYAWARSSLQSHLSFFFSFISLRFIEIIRNARKPSKWPKMAKIGQFWPFLAPEQGCSSSFFKVLFLNFF